MRVLIILSVCLPMSLAYWQEFEFYEDGNINSDSITFKTKATPNLHQWQMDYTRNSSLRCYTGVWLSYTEPNFLGPYEIHNGLPWLNCSSKPWKTSNSLMFLGLPSEYGLHIPSITTFPGADCNTDENCGEEIITTAVAATGFGYLPALALVAGNWTVFQNQNFTGNSTCLQSEEGLQKLYLVDDGLQVFTSVARGCDLNVNDIQKAVDAIQLG